MAFDDHENESQFLYSSGRYDQNSRVMLTAIISLSLVVVVVTILHIYARCVLRCRQARRQAVLHQLEIIATAQVHCTEPPRRGLDPSVIASLPIFVFKNCNNNTNAEMGSIECSVCLSNLEEGEMARTLPNCKHVFHAECIDKWFSTHSTCPICRTEAEPKVQIPQPVPREGVNGVRVAIAPTAPSLDCANSTSMEGISSGGNGMQSSAKINGSSSSRLTSFRRILSRERSARRIQPSGQEDCCEDLERQ